MKFCEECGAQLEDDALFCEECGTPVGPVETEEQQTVEPAKEPEPEKEEPEPVQVKKPEPEPEREAPQPVQVKKPEPEPEKEAPQPVQVKKPEPEPERKAPQPVQVKEPEREALQPVQIKEPEITAPQKGKNKGFIIGGVVAGVVVIAAIIVGSLVLYLGGRSSKKQEVSKENLYVTEKPAENAVEPTENPNVSDESDSKESQTTATAVKKKKKKTESKLQKKWNGMFVKDKDYGDEDDEFGVERLQIILHSKDDIEIEYVVDDYSDDKYTANINAALSDANSLQVMDEDGTGLSFASLSGNTLSVYNEDGEFVGDFERSDNFIIADSFARKLTKSDLKGLSSAELRIARNEIYARHGRMFDDLELQQHFYDTDWYIGYKDANKFNDQKELSKIERYNVGFIQKYE